MLSYSESRLDIIVNKLNSDGKNLAVNLINNKPRELKKNLRSRLLTL
jgi:hypothetical protein